MILLLIRYIAGGVKSWVFMENEYAFQAEKCMHIIYNKPTKVFNGNELNSEHQKGKEIIRKIGGQQKGKPLYVSQEWVRWVEICTDKRGCSLRAI